MSEYVDGVWYDDIQSAPNLGSIKCTGTDGSDHMIRSYMGLSQDADKLPTYVRTGSSCLMIDTGVIYFYEETSQRHIYRSIRKCSRKPSGSIRTRTGGSSRGRDWPKANTSIPTKGGKR